MIRQFRQFWNKMLKNLDVYITIVFAALFSFLGLFDPALSPMAIQSSILATLTILAVSILRSRTALEHVTQNLPSSINLYKHQEDAYKFLEEYIKDRHVREAVFIQYSCNSAMSTLRAILGRGATVTVYIQDENISTSIGAHEQVDRITHWQKSLYSVLANVLRPNCLKLYKYHVPGSVSAIRINLGTEQLLCMGWYTYEHVDDTNRSPAYPSDTVQISGHDIATVVVWSGTEQFDALNKTFSMLENNYQENSQEIIP